MRGSRPAIVASVLAVIALLAWPGAALAAHVTERVSLSSSEAQATADSNYPSLSTDGRYVAFESSAADLVAGDTGGYTDIFVRDRTAGTTERVSVSSSEAQANGDSAGASISADGRYVAFYSGASNLVTGDTNGVSDVFVRDRVLGTTVRVSRSTGGTQGNGSSYRPSISKEGRYVAFESQASNLVSGDTNATQDVFVRDLTGGTTSRVSVSSAEAQTDKTSRSPSISADGRYVAFTSEATNLVGGDTNGKNDIFVRDRTAGTTERVSVATDGTEADGHSDRPAISATGRFVAFESSGANLVADDTLGYMDVFVRDRTAGTTERVSVSTAEAQATNFSYWSSISANGRYIAFQSVATNLAWEDTNGNWDVFLRDRENGSTTMVSVATGWEQGNGPSANPAISVDGRCVAFGSTATNLVAADTNAKADVFTITDHILVGSPPVAYPSLRGSDRYDTAIKISQSMFPGALPADSGVVLAPGYSFQEALCGAPLAAAYGGPVLLTSTTVLYSNVGAELQRLAPDHVVCIGLADSVETAVNAALPGALVTTITGSTVYHMSRNVANALETRVGGDLSGAVALVTIGTNFPDALGLSPLACAKRWPIVLTDQAGGATALHAEAQATFTDLGMTQMLKVGTYSNPPAGVTSLANLSGADRYYTNANVAAWARTNVSLSFAHTAFATGDKYPDALAAGPYLALDDGLLLLSPLTGPVPDVVATLLYANRDDVDELTFIACIEPVMSLVKGLLP